jgi:hypothetical protein
MVTSWGEIRLRLALELLRSPAPEVQLRGRTFDVRALCREAADELTVSFFLEVLLIMVLVDRQVPS